MMQPTLSFGLVKQVKGEVRRQYFQLWGKVSLKNYDVDRSGLLKVTILQHLTIQKVCHLSYCKRGGDIWPSRLTAASSVGQQFGHIRYSR